MSAVKISRVGRSTLQLKASRASLASLGAIVEGKPPVIGYLFDERTDRFLIVKPDPENSSIKTSTGTESGDGQFTFEMEVTEEIAENCFPEEALAEPRIVLATNGAICLHVPVASSYKGWTVRDIPVSLFLELGFLGNEAEFKVQGSYLKSPEGDLSAGLYLVKEGDRVPFHGEWHSLAYENHTILEFERTDGIQVTLSLSRVQLETFGVELVEDEPPRLFYCVSAGDRQCVDSPNILFRGQRRHRSHLPSEGWLSALGTPEPNGRYKFVLEVSEDFAERVDPRKPVIRSTGIGSKCLFIPLSKALIEKGPTTITDVLLKELGFTDQELNTACRCACAITFDDKVQGRGLHLVKASSPRPFAGDWETIELKAGTRIDFGVAGSSSTKSRR